MKIRDRIIHGETLSVDYTDAWLEMLHDIDAEHPTLDELRAARNELDHLSAVAAEISITEPAAPASIPKLDGDVLTAADAIKAVKRERAASQDQIDAAHHAVQERITETTRAYTGGFDRFTRSDLLATIKPHHDALAARAVALASQLPDGLSNDDDARLGGRLSEWVELGEVLHDLEELRRLVADLRERKYLAAYGRRGEQNYLTAEFHYRNVDQALHYLSWNTRVGHARALQHGEPALLRVQEIDTLRSRTPELPARDEDAYRERRRRQTEVDSWTAGARRTEELQRMREHEEQMAANSRARMARR